MSPFPTIGYSGHMTRALRACVQGPPRYSFRRVVAIPAALLAMLWTLGAAIDANAASPFDGQVREYSSKQIYHSPETPGFTAWVGLWQMTDGSIECGFTQKTGPKSSPVTTYPVIRSTDKGSTWTRAPGDVPTGRTFGMTILPDGTMVRPQWGSLENNAGYVERSTDGGKTWSQPIHFTDTSKNRAWPDRIRQLSDGRLVLQGGAVSRSIDAQHRPQNIAHTAYISSDGGKTWGPPIQILPLADGACEESDFVELPNGNLLFMNRTMYYDANGKMTSQDRKHNILVKSGSTFVPQPPTLTFPGYGLPNLLLTREGAILDFVDNGRTSDGTYYASQWSSDSGATWHPLTLPDKKTQISAYYYPESVQLSDGTIVVVGHRGADNTYGSVDQAIMMQTFRIGPPLPVTKPGA